MTTNDAKEKKICYFWDVDNYNISSHIDYPLLDEPNDFLNDSLLNMICLEKEPDSYPNLEIIPNFSSKINIDIPEKIFPTEKKRTDISTNTNNPQVFSYNEIEGLLNDESFNIYLNKIKESKNKQELKDIYHEMNIKKRPRKKYQYHSKEKDDSLEIKSKNDRGRKKGEDITPRPHNNISADNIIKKLKGYFIRFLIIFVNSIINRGKNKKDKIELKSLDHHKYLNNIKKEEDLNLLKITVKDYLSQDISPKHIKSNSDWNKNAINTILNTQKDDEAINFVFNMTIKNWIELFTLKKSIFEFDDLSINGREEIESKIPSLLDLFDEIYEKYEDDIYFTKFVFYLYNYENWFESKRGRNRENKI